MVSGSDNEEKDDEIMRLKLKETELCLGLPGAGGGGGGGGDQLPETPKSTGKRGYSHVQTTTVDFKLITHLVQSNDHHHHHQSLDHHEYNINDIVASKVNMDLPPKLPPAKAQVVGWPPVRSYRKNMMAQNNTSKEGVDKKGSSSMSNNTGAFVKVCMDGAPYLRKVDLKLYNSYSDLSDALAKMFSSFTMGNYGTQGMIDFMNESKLMDLLNSSDYVPTYEDKDGDWMLVGDVPWEMFVDSCKRLRIMKGSEAIGLAPRAMEKCKNRS